MAKLAKFLSSASSVGAGLDVDEVFNTFLYKGNGTPNTKITTGIDLQTEGGLLWIKRRSSSSDHYLFDSINAFGGGTSTTNLSNRLKSNEPDPMSTESNALMSFETDGFIVSTNGAVNGGGGSNEYVSWTFRKCPKFFDIQSWSGDDTTGRTISHNLGCQAGLVVVKDLDGSVEWTISHHSKPNYISYFTSLAPFSATYIHTLTSSSFTLGDTVVNSTGRNYVAYIFAHNDNNGGFGPDGNQDIIKCGVYSSNGTINNINIGFEPQWVLFKRFDGGDSWYLLDSMRGFVDLSTGDKTLIPSGTNQEEDLNTNFFGSQGPSLTPTGFELKTAALNGSSGEYLYMAIRRGPLNTPTSASDVFAVDQGDITTTDPQYVSNFIVDMAIDKDTNANSDNRLSARLIQKRQLNTNTTQASQGNTNFLFDYMSGWYDNQNNQYWYSWMWKRARGYFDVVTWDGNNTSGRTISHNLGVVPEMIWIKNRGYSGGEDWAVYHKGLNGGTDPEDYYLKLNTTSSESNNAGNFNDTAPTSTVFTVGSDRRVNGNVADGNTYIAYLFASVAGVSKVGSYTGDGTTDGSKVIDCGFSNGAKFVLIKRADTAGNWVLMDSVRGISSFNDPYIYLNNSPGFAPGSTADFIEPNSSGFAIASNVSDINALDGSYIFYAIAAS